ncbi:MAG TPA: thioredoxin-disulfide reductase [Elusimicrobiota bacterium]|nr:thioredoxin-disulfide reductase [Elusimicrobiota bacterium]
MAIRNVIIIGSGPAGYTAAIYTARAGLSPLMIAGYMSGGQLMMTTEIENFPGFPEAILGPDLMERMRQQADRFKTEIVNRDVTAVNLRRKPFQVTVEGVLHESHAVILATGASVKWMGLPNEKRLLGKGVSSCATCDGAFFRGKEICVVGGGDTALEEAIFLTKFASRVTVIHRRDQFRASKIMMDRARANPKISWKVNAVVSDVLGDSKVEGLRIRNVINGEQSDLKVEGVFVAIGHSPNTDLFKGHVALDDQGYIVTDRYGATSVPGVFAAGDVQDRFFRQAVTSAGSGCAAAIQVERYLETLAL